MKLNPSPEVLAEENYRIENGSESLVTYLELATSKIVLIKHHDAEIYRVVDIETLVESEVEPSEFRRRFTFCLLPDDMVFYFGNETSVEAAKRQLELIEVARKKCLQDAEAHARELNGYHTMLASRGRS
jgi:hypothetical protein